MGEVRGGKASKSGAARRARSPSPTCEPGQRAGAGRRCAQPGGPAGGPRARTEPAGGRRSAGSWRAPPRWPTARSAGRGRTRIRMRVGRGRCTRSDRLHRTLRRMCEGGRRFERRAPVRGRGPAPWHAGPHLEQVLQLHGAAAVLAVEEGLALRLQGRPERRQRARPAGLGVKGDLFARRQGGQRCAGRIFVGARCGSPQFAKILLAAPAARGSRPGP